MFVGVPTNMGLGSFSLSSCLFGSCCAASGAKVKQNNSEIASVGLVIEVLGNEVCIFGVLRVGQLAVTPRDHTRPSILHISGLSEVLRVLSGTRGAQPRHAAATDRHRLSSGHLFKPFCQPV